MTFLYNFLEQCTILHPKKMKKKWKIGMNNNSKEGMKFQDTVIQWTIILQFNCKNSKEGIGETEMGHNSKAMKKKISKK